MLSTQLLLWILWGLSLLAGVVAVLALFKLRYAERFLPKWTELTQLDALLPVRRDELRQATENIEKCRGEIGQLEATVGHLRILKEWNDANPEAAARIQQMMLDLERYKSELAAIQSKLAQDEQRLNQVKHDSDKLILDCSRMDQEKGRLLDEVAHLQKGKTELDQSISNLQQKQRDLQGKCDALVQNHEAKTRDLGDILEKLEIHKKQNQDAEASRDKAISECNVANLELLRLTEENKRLRGEFANLQKDKAALDQNVINLQQAERDLQNQYNQLLVKQHDKDKELDETIEKLAVVQKQKRDAEDSRDKALADCNAAKAELFGLQKTLEVYKVLVENLNSQLKKVSLGDTDINKSLEDLAQPVLKSNFNHSATMDEATALNRLRDHLLAKGLHYPERVQLAFHTSLKAAQINPLVVLAGVSGTGKSALPMAYAEAMGMNFMSLAVQPGWSGPQDLLGFYNYLEKKYKATELARALAQMSRFSNEDLPGLDIKSRKDQMLLLLLDEMNLARIEYYFSDFLSRLEQRRGRNVQDAQRRREVSLLVDAGSLPATEMARFIFPDFNVLFVGTMNEDESTQSLSDKVIDRANVLRFGAPKDLKAAPAPTIDLTTNFLQRAKWEEWVKSFGGTGLDKERAILTGLNQTLESVNRPFGHRVYRAILDYITNYPNAMTNAGCLRDAMADQMEQKIIPKLRGLDTQDDANARCLEKVGQTISSLQDNDLIEAFNKARQPHLFEWFGVKRS